MDYDEIAVLDDRKEDEVEGSEGSNARTIGRSPLSKTRSLSDGGGTPGRRLSPSPLILGASRRASKDDSSLPLPCDAATAAASSTSSATAAPVTPRRPAFSLRAGLSLQMQMPQREFSPAPQSPYVKPAPLSPKLDHSQIYASPTNILPRRSRGLDFSRAATSLHHSTLAEQSSPDSSPTIGGGRAMNIPSRSLLRGPDYGAAETTNSLWSMMGNQEKMNISSSLGSTNNACFDSSSSSDEMDLMDEDNVDESFVTTPQLAKVGGIPATGSGISQTTLPWGSSSPAFNSLLSFQQRQRPRKLPKKKVRAPGLGFSSINPTAPGHMSKSPPNNAATTTSTAKEMPLSQGRRESISWAANQLHISGSEGEDNARSHAESSGGLAVTPSRDGPRGGVVRRVVTRRGNLLPKPKGFARIQAALAEESAPVEAEFRHEAEVVRQVRESDMELELRIPPQGLLDTAATATTTPSSPNLGPAGVAQDNMDEMSEDAMMVDSGLGLSSSFKQQALRNYRGSKNFWDTFSESSSIGGLRTTPPPPSSSAFVPRGSTSGLSVDDISMDSPSGASSVGPTGPLSFVPPGGVFAMTTAGSSSGGDTPQPVSQGAGGGSAGPGGAASAAGPPQPPTAAEITRRINSKRRRDDDFDPVSFKRRAVSPGMSVHNSPIMQSPLQRDVAPWGSRPGSNGGERPGGGGSGSGAPSEAGSQGGGQCPNGGNGGNGGAARVNGNKYRVGYQGMVDTNDGITRLSIE